MNWYKDSKYGLMIHWGLYTVAMGEWKQNRLDMENLVAERKAFNVGEWLQCRYDIPIAEYSLLAKAFNPIFFDAEEWAKAAKEWGMKYMVVTAKHHDGFAMYDSKVDDYNIVKATPFGRDIIRELSNACKKYGIKFGVYYSQALDWHEENGGDYWPLDTERLQHANIWDFPDNEKKDFNVYFNNKVIPQVTELLTNYDNIEMIWFDAADRQIPAECSERLYKLINEIKPGIITNTRIGHGFGEVNSFDDNEFPDDSFVEGLYETPCTLNNTWGYVAHDQYWKDAEEVIKLKNHLNSRGVNYLLNVGPDPLGRIPVRAREILDEVGKKLKENL